MGQYICYDPDFHELQPRCCKQEEKHLWFCDVPLFFYQMKTSLFLSFFLFLQQRPEERLSQRSFGVTTGAAAAAAVAISPEIKKKKVSPRSDLVKQAESFGSLMARGEVRGEVRGGGAIGGRERRLIWYFVTIGFNAGQ